MEEGDLYEDLDTMRTLQEDTLQQENEEDLYENLVCSGTGDEHAVEGDDILYDDIYGIEPGTGNEDLHPEAARETGQRIKDLEIRTKELESRNAELEDNLKKLQAQNDLLKTTKEDIEKNMASLIDTCRLEIGRKNEELRNSTREMENILFKRAARNLNKRELEDILIKTRPKCEYSCLGKLTLMNKKVELSLQVHRKVVPKQREGSDRNNVQMEIKPSSITPVKSSGADTQGSGPKREKRDPKDSSKFAIEDRLRAIANSSESSKFIPGSKPSEPIPKKNKESIGFKTKQEASKKSSHSSEIKISRIIVECHKEIQRKESSVKSHNLKDDIEMAIALKKSEEGEVSDDEEKQFIPILNQKVKVTANPTANCDDLRSKLSRKNYSVAPYDSAEKKNADIEVGTVAIRVDGNEIHNTSKSTSTLSKDSTINVNCVAKQSDKSKTDSFTIPHQSEEIKECGVKPSITKSEVLGPSKMLETEAGEEHDDQVLEKENKEDKILKEAKDNVDLKHSSISVKDKKVPRENENIMNKALKETEHNSSQLEKNTSTSGIVSRSNKSTEENRSYRNEKDQRTEHSRVSCKKEEESRRGVSHNREKENTVNKNSTYKIHKQVDNHKGKGEELIKSEKMSSKNKSSEEKYQENHSTLRNIKSQKQKHQKPVNDTPENKIKISEIDFSASSSSTRLSPRKKRPNTASLAAQVCSLENSGRSSDMNGADLQNPTRSLKCLEGSKPGSSNMDTNSPRANTRDSDVSQRLTTNTNSPADDIGDSKIFLRKTRNRNIQQGNTCESNSSLEKPNNINSQQEITRNRLASEENPKDLYKVTQWNCDNCQLGFHSRSVLRQHKRDELCTRRGKGSSTSATPTSKSQEKSKDTPIPDVGTKKGVNSSRTIKNNSPRDSATKLTDGDSSSASLAVSGNMAVSSLPRIPRRSKPVQGTDSNNEVSSYLTAPLPVSSIELETAIKSIIAVDNILGDNCCTGEDDDIIQLHIGELDAFEEVSENSGNTPKIKTGQDSGKDEQSVISTEETEERKKTNNKRDFESKQSRQRSRSRGRARSGSRSRMTKRRSGECRLKTEKSGGSSARNDKQRNRRDAAAESRSRRQKRSTQSPMPRSRSRGRHRRSDSVSARYKRSPSIDNKQRRSSLSRQDRHRTDRRRDDDRGVKRSRRREKEVDVDVSLDRKRQKMEKMEGQSQSRSPQRLESGRGRIRDTEDSLSLGELTKMRELVLKQLSNQSGDYQGEEGEITDSETEMNQEMALHTGVAPTSLAVAAIDADAVAADSLTQEDNCGGSDKENFTREETVAKYSKESLARLRESSATLSATCLQDYTTEDLVQTLIPHKKRQYQELEAEERKIQAEIAKRSKSITPSRKNSETEEISVPKVSPLRLSLRNVEIQAPSSSSESFPSADSESFNIAPTQVVGETHSTIYHDDNAVFNDISPTKEVMMDLQLSDSDIDSPAKMALPALRSSSRLANTRQLQPLRNLTSLFGATAVDQLVNTRKSKPGDDPKVSPITPVKSLTPKSASKEIAHGGSGGSASLDFTSAEGISSLLRSPLVSYQTVMSPCGEMLGSPSGWKNPITPKTPSTYSNSPWASGISSQSPKTPSTLDNNPQNRGNLNKNVLSSERSPISSNTKSVSKESLYDQKKPASSTSIIQNKVDPLKRVRQMKAKKDVIQALDIEETPFSPRKKGSSKADLIIGAVNCEEALPESGNGDSEEFVSSSKGLSTEEIAESSSETTAKFLSDSSSEDVTMMKWALSNFTSPVKPCRGKCSNHEGSVHETTLNTTSTTEAYCSIDNQSVINKETSSKQGVDTTIKKILNHEKESRNLNSERNAGCKMTSTTSCLVAEHIVSKGGRAVNKEDGDRKKDEVEVKKKKKKGRFSLCSSSTVITVISNTQ